MKSSNAQNISDYLSKAAIATASTILIAGLSFGQDVVSENNSDDTLVSLPGTDVVLDWQTVGANLTTNQFLFDRLPDVGTAPPQGTRAGAILSASMFNAFAGATGEFDAQEIFIDQGFDLKGNYESTSIYAKQKSVVIWCRMANATMGFAFLNNSAAVGSENQKIVAKFFFVNRGNSDKPNQNLDYIA